MCGILRKLSGDRDLPRRRKLKPGKLRLKKIGLPAREHERRSAGTRQISAKTRRKVFERDGFRCVRCRITVGAEYADVPGKLAR